MTEQISLKEIEKKSYTSFIEDGIYEILFAHIMLTGMLSSLLHEAGVSDIIRVSIYVPVTFLGVLIVYLGKKYITTPRMGTVRFGTQRKRKIRTLHVFIILFVIISLSLAALTMTGNLHTDMPIPFLIPVILFSFFAVAAWLKDYPRFYLSGFLFAVSEVTYTVLENKGIVSGRSLLAYGIPGLIILISGIYSLIKFLKKYPKIEIEVPDE